MSWKITPRTLLEATTIRDQAAAKRAFDAMMGMKKIHIAAIETARRGQFAPARDDISAAQRSEQTTEVSRARERKMFK